MRFIDNFSGGTRGALSTERFLEVCAQCQMIAVLFKWPQLGR